MQGDTAPLKYAKAKLEEWSKVWLVEDAEAQARGRPWLQCVPGDDDALPPITGDMVEAVGARLKECTALKVDGLHPKVAARASPEAREAFAGLLMQAEASGSWPSQVALIVYALLLKPEGGERPVGIFGGTIRLWEQVLLPLMKQWMQ